jgi:serine/threonine protein kinase
LHLAAQLGYRELVTYLITQAEFRCSVDTLNRKGVTAFYVACAAGQWGIAQDLLAQGTKLTVQDHQGRTLLHHAVLDQEPTVLTYLLTDPRFKKIRVSLVNIPDLHGQTPLHCAIQQEDEKLVRQLLYAGANANLVNQAGETPSDLAYRTGNLCLIGYLKNAEYIALPVADDPVPMPTTWVRIRVWSAQEHISCETPELNLHLWLANDANPDVSVDEGQDQPDIDIVLYSLQLAALHAAFNQLYQRDPYWFLSGRDKFAANQPNISEVVFDLLLAGGISHLVGMAAVSDNKTINVNAVMTLLRRAKQAEQEKYLDLHADEAVFVTQAALVHITQAHYQLLLAEFRSKLPENEHSLWLPWLQEIVATKPSTQDIPFVIAAQDFTKGRELGRGGFGVVYQGQHHEKVVAIKQLLSFKQEYIKDFMTEVAVMAQLDHPCIVTCFGVCLEKQYSIVMEYMPGGSLHALLQAHRNEIETWDVEWRVRFPIMQDVSNGLAFLHRYYPKAILHCDLKPENVLLAPEGGAKLADFGLAQFKGEMSTYSACNEHGTHGFMAPELFEEYAKFSKASDVFSLGMLFWVMTACKKPFANFTMAIAATQQLLKGNREVFAFGTAPRIVALIQHCWLQEPQKRPDMQDIHRLLSQGYDSFFAHSSPVITAETILSFPAEQGVQEWLHESYYREEGSMIIKLENETTLSMQLLSEEFSIPTTNSILVDLTKYIITAVGERHVLLSQVAEGITTLSFTSIPALQAVLRLLESEGFPRPIAASALPQYHCN